jgi:hypothetical protein
MMISKSMHGVWSTTTLPSSRQRKKPITTVTWVIRYGGLGVAIVVEPLEIVGGVIAEVVRNIAWKDNGTLV